MQTRSGIEAVEIAREHRPDLILMDIQLPEVSGLEVTQWLKDDEELRHIPVIAITAFAMKGDEEKILQRRLRGLSFETDLGGEVLRDDRPLPRPRRRGPERRAAGGARFRQRRPDRRAPCRPSSHFWAGFEPFQRVATTFPGARVGRGQHPTRVALVYIPHSI